MDEKVEFGGIKKLRYGKWISENVMFRLIVGV
jgi:hypothetical protein